MQEFVAGQRWINDAELQLGLGTVLNVEHRTVQIVFLASGDTRVYAKNNAPLTRVKFVIGDKVPCADGREVLVTEIHDVDGIITYEGTDENGQAELVPETQLDNFIQLNRPGERLFTSQIDKDKWFELRYQTWQEQHRLSHSQLRGLTGCRTSLIPHQLYIAHEVARRFAPRVLLADEVGLGKTIEAGLIIHHQLLTERAKRVLIVVPETLLHQWLVEMLRRFNLRFSVFDAERLSSMSDNLDIDDEWQEPTENPFLDEQLVLCSQNFLADNSDYADLAIAGEWDMLVVDEAHHLEWAPDNVSTEYQLVADLAAVTPGVLLLTATPEQLGKDSHFARLRLLDPDRFTSYENFLKDEAHYEPIANAVEALLGDADIGDDVMAVLQETISEDDNASLINELKTNPSNIEARSDLLEHMLDRHGTGRVLFRNTRAAVQGFPGREVNGYDLTPPALYDNYLSYLDPEHAYRNDGSVDGDWFKQDPRITWLQDFLKQMRQEKILLITASADSALDITEALRVQTGLHAAVFHEGMSIIERDRAAAYFADKDYGSQLLVCSEIGSEGRNFQFAHHLVLFDLPRNPDLLEQRIGRLDRIGQTDTIQIHVPYLQDSAQEIMFRWYNEGLQAFSGPCPAAHSVFTQMFDAINDACAIQVLSDAIIEETQSLNERLLADMKRGRDRLLEYNSCRPRVAKALQEEALDQDDNSAVASFMDLVFDCFGVESENHSDEAIIIRPSENMFVQFPLLPDEGMTLTYDRDAALACEDLHFLNWEHDMVVAAMDLVCTNENGNTALIAVKTPALKPGSLLLETLFVLESPGHASRYLPPSTVRIVINESGQSLEDRLSHELLNTAKISVKKKTAVQVIGAKTKELETMIARCKALAEPQASQMAEQALAASSHHLGEEINRLRALQQVNPSVRDAEIEFFEDELKTVNNILEHATLRFDALRVIVAT